MINTYKLPIFALVLDFDRRLVILLDNLEGPVLPVTLNLGIVDLAADETLSIKDRVLWVRVVGVLGSISDTEYVTFSLDRQERKRHAYSRSSSVKLTHEGVIR